MSKTCLLFIVSQLNIKSKLVIRQLHCTNMTQGMAKLTFEVELVKSPIITTPPRAYLVKRQSYSLLLSADGGWYITPTVMQENGRSLSHRLS